MRFTPNNLAGGILLVAFFGAGFSVANALLKRSQAPHTGSSPATSQELPQVASPTLSPEDVVKTQLDALRASKTDPDQMAVCFGLASPSNRRLTGPLDRFAEMAGQPPFDHLLTSAEWQMGTAVVEDHLATVLVTTIDADGTSFAYRFLLAKQAEPPNEDCWMTDGVQALAPVPFGVLDDGR